MDALSLADYRARVAAMYLSDVDMAGFRALRDDLFATHPQSAAPGPLRYFPHDEDFAATVPMEPAEGTLEIATGGEDGVLTYTRVGHLPTPWGRLTLFWLQAYGGGLFLPFRDGTSGRETYGAGRYLTDTVKGTHGRGVVALPDGRVRLDFNYAYNPSCAYDDAWACPLAPYENRLDAPIRAGEMTYHR
ncbi:DUF1684 domain-containing protein [Dactylosporangium sp. AC04546]|uniref:DUF1684 domain-containing protein n=1 Tax=Dactylosporangium sp. AC04546 TaxID=2862460 RepID=UPI001EDE628C|nr:DUF1684 domain-containing protein [Dactylosporangium sp. AC04546]WVK84381.1 DUF1684 domain-containing protein [Dactylosporangium sp. AC04546]